MVDGVLDGALGALGDEVLVWGGGVFVPSSVKSMKSCFGDIIVSLGFLDCWVVDVFVSFMDN